MSYHAIRKKDRKWFYDQYVTQHKNMAQIAKENNCSTRLVGQILRGHHIKRHPKGRTGTRHNKYIPFQKWKASMGCNRCGYNKCGRALLFHHTYKENRYKIRTSNYTSDTTKKEIKNKRQILLCYNCHIELHYKTGFHLSHNKLDL